MAFELSPVVHCVGYATLSPSGGGGGHIDSLALRDGAPFVVRCPARPRTRRRWGSKWQVWGRTHPLHGGRRLPGAGPGLGLELQSPDILVCTPNAVHPPL